jgi:hypothetical protein
VSAQVSTLSAWLRVKGLGFRGYGLGMVVKSVNRAQCLGVELDVRIQFLVTLGSRVQCLGISDTRV